MESIREGEGEPISPKSDDFGYEMIETLTLIVDGALTYAPFGPDNTLDAQEGRTMCPALFSQFSAR